MSKYLLNDRQKELLRSLVPGLKDGTVATEWLIMYGDNKIRVMGLGDKGLSEWDNATSADYAKFVKCGFFEVVSYGRYGPERYILDDTLIIQAVSDFDSETESQIQDEKMPTDSRSVFVVHGRNEKARDALFTFLRAIDLKPIEWSQAIKHTGQGSPSIGDILKVAFSQAQAVIVLFTPDDEARLLPLFQKSNDPPYEKQYNPQARPNVLFEAGMAMGHLASRTILVELGNIRPFSDISGLHVIRLDNSSPTRNNLVGRLKTAGCSVDTQGTDWLKAGNFEEAIASLPIYSNSTKWENTGNLWWLCSDTIHTINYLMGKMPRSQIVDGLRRVHHHAMEINIDPTIVEQLWNLKEQAISSNDGYWTDKKREEIAQILGAVFNSVAKLAVDNQPNFRPDPD